MGCCHWTIATTYNSSQEGWIFWRNNKRIMTSLNQSTQVYPCGQIRGCLIEGVCSITTCKPVPGTENNIHDRLVASLTWPMTLSLIPVGLLTQYTFRFWIFGCISIQDTGNEDNCMLLSLLLVTASPIRLRTVYCQITPSSRGHRCDSSNCSTNKSWLAACQDFYCTLLMIHGNDCQQPYLPGVQDLLPNVPLRPMTYLWNYTQWCWRTISSSHQFTSFNWFSPVLHIMILGLWAIGMGSWSSSYSVWGGGWWICPIHFIRWCSYKHTFGMFRKY